MSNTTTTTGTIAFTLVDGTVTDLDYLGNGEWEMDTPAGTFEISSTSDGENVLATDSVLVTGPNHHYPDAWFDTKREALDYLRKAGIDGRTARHMA
jgi:hypothetical protein